MYLIHKDFLYVEENSMILFFIFLKATNYFLSKSLCLMVSILTFPVLLVSVQTYSWPHEGILPSVSYLDTCMFCICYAVEAKTKTKH